jgi:hypothetical protein
MGKVDNEGGIRRTEKVDSRGEEYVRGRRSGVQGTYGAPRSKDSMAPVGTLAAEKTVYPGQDSSLGGGEDSLGSTAAALYGNSIKNGGGREDAVGDKALKDR